MGSASSKLAVNVVADNDEKRSYQAHSRLASDMSSLCISPPISRDGSLSLRNVAAWESTSSSDPKRQLARTILSHSDIRSALTSRSARIADQHVFNHQIDFITQPITNQKSSGRCWLFATTNVLRYEVMKKLKLKEFQLSQVCTMSSLFIILFAQTAHTRGMHSLSDERLAFLCDGAKSIVFSIIKQTGVRITPDRANWFLFMFYLDA
jgi:hypothetical protein